MADITPANGGEVTSPERTIELPVLRWWPRTLWVRIGISVGDPLVVVAFAAVDAELAAEYEAVDEWWMGERWDHIYPNCPGLARSGQPRRQGGGRLYPEAGDVCGTCIRWWRARKAKAASLPPETLKEDQ